MARHNSVKMTVAQFLNKEWDIDVYDDIEERISIAFCGPCILTKKGKEKFEPLMNIWVEVWEDDCYALLFIDGRPDWKEKLDLAELLFNGFAGYISDERWHELFKED